jgi:hypothetical protein
MIHGLNGRHFSTLTMLTEKCQNIFKVGEIKRGRKGNTSQLLQSLDPKLLKPIGSVSIRVRPDV